ncbi:MAG: DNA alkylation repair protein [Candidatus Eisenbacteria bacterium]
MEKKKMTREEREALRGAVAKAVEGATPENAGEVARSLAPLLLPDPTVPPGKNGLRAAREPLVETAETLQKSVKKAEVLGPLVEALGAAGLPEARVVAALCLAPLLPTDDEEKEERSWEAVRAFVAASEAAPVREAVADALARAMEQGAADSWSRAFQAWSAGPDPRLRALGPASFATLFGRGKAPEKLFEGLQLARGLAGDPDADVRRAVIALLVAAGRRQGPAVARFLSRLETDEREGARKLAADAAKRLAC